MYKYSLPSVLLIFILLFSGNSYSQNIPYQINLDTAVTNKTDSVLVFVKNPENQILHIYSVRTLTTQFFTKVFSLNVNPLDSSSIWIYFKTNQNITYYDFIIFESLELNYPIVNYLIATGKYPDNLYNFTQGLIDEPLKIALKNYCSTNTNNNYTTSRTAMFSTIDDYNSDDTISCVYTGRKVYTTGIPSVNPPQSMNTEHTFPQGFFNQDEPMRSDIHHLFPTDETANNRRNNYDFGYVVSNVTWENGGSKLGNDYENQLVFEARDQHKGNVARALFYFLIRYQNYGGFMDAKQENVLRRWNLTDTVDANERQRENGIQAFQNNRNPFTDHPEFIDRIKSTYSVIPAINKPEISASPFNVVFDTLAVNDTSGFYLSLFNYGTGNLNINSVTSSSPQFIVENFPSTVPQHDFRYAKIKFRPDQLNQTFNSVLTINNNDSVITVNLKGFSNNTVGVTSYSQIIPNEYSLKQNYPNPFNPATSIIYEIPNFMSGSLQNVKLIIYNSLGKELDVLVNEMQKAGSYSVKWNASLYPSGIYYYTIHAGRYSDTKKMILLK